MFSKNEFQQLSFNDSVLNMPEYLKKILQDSWAHPFSHKNNNKIEKIFPGNLEKKERKLLTAL